jgi:hypothetical protein
MERLSRGGSGREIIIIITKKMEDFKKRLVMDEKGYYGSIAERTPH